MFTMSARGRLAFALVILVGLFLPAAFQPRAGAAQTKAEAEWLPLCRKCPGIRIFSESGIGTKHAIAEARLTYADAKSNCENYASPSSDCDKEAKDMVEQQAGKIYRASADCIHGKIVDIYGDTYTYAGIWASGLGKGRTRWRDAKGQIAGPDGPYNGPSISAIGEVLCPKGFGPDTSKHSG